jgi:hypothetical protein
MNKGNDILSVIFLALICIVIAGIVKGLGIEGSGLIIPSFVFMAIGLWIAYDYMMVKRYRAKEKCNKDRIAMLEARMIASQMAEDDEDNRNIPVIETPVEHAPARIAKPKKERHDEYDIDLYNGETSIKDMHTNMGCTGDTMICNRMKYMAVQPQLSKDIRARWNKNSFMPYVEEELREHAEREWWNSDHLDEEM